MPIAAVPRYLGQDFKEASPGMRFGHFLPIWTTRQDQEEEVQQRASARSDETSGVAKTLRRDGMDAAITQLQSQKSNPLAGLWGKNDFAAKFVWKNICALTTADAERMGSLLTRQQAAFATALPAQALCLEATATAPFTTGLGNEHPLENGFSFLNPYGLPYLPGSGVKGVLRQAARELASGEWGDPHGWSAVDIVPPAIERKCCPISLLDVLFGLESQDGAQEHLRGALTFWDVIPQIYGDILAVEIMTPHQSHYYQQKRGDSLTPHDSGQPNPISFLTVPARSRFSFFVTCDQELLARHAPFLVADEHWKTLLTAAFEHAFEWLGFGAKTAVGYGAMLSASQQLAKQEADAKYALKAREEERRSEEIRQEQEAVAWENARIKFEKNGTLTVEKGGKSAFAIAPRGEELLATLSAEVQKKVRGHQFVKVTAYVYESTLVRVLES